MVIGVEASFANANPVTYLVSWLKIQLYVASERFNVVWISLLQTD